jgi:glycosidase
MSHIIDELDRQIRISLDRLKPRIKAKFCSQIETDPLIWDRFIERLDAHFPRLFRLYYQLYASQYDFFYHLEDLLSTLARMWLERPADLKKLDGIREADPDWFHSPNMLGGVCYVDLFGGDLRGIQQKIPYFAELGLTYLHLMPLFNVPSGENDGGYAVSSYRQVKPDLGTTRQLRTLASGLHKVGISLVLDLVFNHTSDEHEWAKGALMGDLEYQEYYLAFSDRRMPDAYEKNLREIFPDEHPGAFTFQEEIEKWVWTTFHSYQWDLNYANPVVFNKMVEEMLYLANLGVEVLRLDAVAFIWKRLGTSCENLPEAHWLIQAFNAVARIAAPALLFKSEAIVHPDEVARYIDPGECQLSYNPLLMALLWESLATRETRLLDHALRHRLKIVPNCAWVNYVRCHDDIGWTFSDEDAASLNINAYDHRRFLNDFYSGRFPDSFARGLPFQENPQTGDARISGTCASLAGLEKAVMEDAPVEIDLAIRRILLIHALIFTVGGIPLIYLGDEVGWLNDYDYRNNPAKAGDSRWVHRPVINWEIMERRHDPDTIEGRIFIGIQNLIAVRKRTPAFSGNRLRSINTENAHVLGFLRRNGTDQVLVLANFSEREQRIAANQLRLYGLSYRFRELITGQVFELQDLVLDSYGFSCLEGIGQD